MLQVRTHSAQFRLNGAMSDRVTASARLAALPLLSLLAAVLALLVPKLALDPAGARLSAALALTAIAVIFTCPDLPFPPCAHARISRSCPV